MRITMPRGGEYSEAGLSSERQRSVAELPSQHHESGDT
jgi:hypothetical protein